MRTKGGDSNQKYQQKFFQKQSKWIDNNHSKTEKNRSNFLSNQLKKLTTTTPLGNPSGEEVALNATILLSMLTR